MPENGWDKVVMYVPSSKMRPQWVLLDFDARLRSPGIQRHRVLDRKLVTYRDNGGELHIADEACPHRGASLAGGAVDGKALVCPYHLRPCSMRTHPSQFYEFAALQGMVWLDVASNVITQHFMPPYYPELSSPDYETHRSSRVLHVNPLVLMEHLIDRRVAGTPTVSQGGPYGRERFLLDTPRGTVTLDVEYVVPFTCVRRYTWDGTTVLLTMLSVLPLSGDNVRLHVVTAHCKAIDATDVIEEVEARHAPRPDVVSGVDLDRWHRNALALEDDFIRAYREAMALFYPEMASFCISST